MNFKLLLNAEVFAPRPIGRQAVLLAGDRLAKIGNLDKDTLAGLEPELEVIDVSGCLLTPGLVDPHAHLIGAGGEEGFASRMPEVLVSQLVTTGVTTVIGLLGTDTSTRALPCLYAKTSQLWDEGLTAYMYTGGFELPPSTLTDSVLDDLVMIDKIIGVGEIAVSDPRWIDPTLDALAHVVASASLGGKMGGKAGVTHFHVGPGKRRLGLVHELLDTYDLKPSSLDATHINRGEALIDDGIALAKRGAYVDMDTVEEDLVERLRYYRNQGGPLERLSVSSDAHTPEGSHRKFYDQMVACACEGELPLAEVLPLFTCNAATALKLESKGRLIAGGDADVLALRSGTLEIVHVFARGRQLVRDGELVELSKQEQQVRAGKE
jgi:beta-aspartyl-dipeptidase (metallo-type)